MIKNQLFIFCLVILSLANTAHAAEYIAVFEREASTDETETGWYLQQVDCVSGQLVQSHEFKPDQLRVWVTANTATACFQAIAFNEEGEQSEPTELHQVTAESCEPMCDWITTASRSDGTRPAYEPGTKKYIGRIDEGICCGERDPNSIRISDNWRLAVDQDGNTVETYCSER